MAYSSVGRPVFYIDNYLYHKTIGTSFTKEMPFPEKTLQLNPVFGDQELGLLLYDASLPVNQLEYDFSGNMNYYIAFLNHVRDINQPLSFLDDMTNVTGDFTEVLNGNGDGSFIYPNNGSTILTTSSLHENLFFLHEIFGFNYMKVGSVSMGIQYTMPHSPDLKLNMEIEMDGIDTTTTSGGGTISNVKYTGNPLWINGDNKTNCFDVYGEDGLDVTQTGARRNGRKSWNLKFSYMSETDLFSSNPKGGNYTEHPADSTYNDGDLSSAAQHSENTLAFNIETDDSFYAQVWNKTLGGALPFIFQPNSNDNDDFYICRFDQNSLRVSQSAYKVYDISVKIVETW